MPEFATPEGLESNEDVDLLFAVHWHRQAEGFARQYEQSGDTDYMLMSIEAAEMAVRQQQIVSAARGLLDCLGEA